MPRKRTDIYFLTSAPFSERDMQRFGFELLRKNGFHPKVCDLTAIINPRVLGGNKAQEDSNVIKYFDSITGFRHFCENLDTEKSLVIDRIGFNDVSRFIFEAFEDYKTPIVGQYTNAIPKVAWKNYWQPHHLIRGIHNRLRRTVERHYVCQPLFVMCGSQKDVNKIPYGMSDAQIVWTHALDYDRYLEFNKNPRTSPVKRPYAVFLDVNFARHPEFKNQTAQPNPFVRPSDYFDELNIGLYELERNLNMPVVVAAHPSTNVQEAADEFEQRQVFKGKTLELVAEADCVVAHCSTSVNFAVLFKKPIVFFMLSRLRGTFYGRLMNRMARELGQTPLDIIHMHEENIRKAMKIDGGKYAEYRENYIKTYGSDEKPTWEIFIQYLDQLENKEHKSHPEYAGV